MRLFHRKDRDCWCVQFMHRGMVHTISLSRSERNAQRATVHLLHLLDTAKCGGEIRRETQVWVSAQIGDELRQRLIDIGLIDPAAAVQSQALSRHIDDWRDALKARGRSAQHVREVVAKVRRVCDECGFSRYEHLVTGRVAIERWIASVRVPAPDGPDLSARTVNGHTAALLQFGAWMVSAHRAVVMPSIERSPLEAKRDRRRERFSMGPAGLQKLIDTTQTKGVERGGMSGHDRVTLWWFATETGFRASELARVTPAGLQKHEDLLLVTIPASKAGGAVTQPIVTKALIRRVLDQARMLAPAARLWPVRVRGASTTVDALRADMADAGLPVQDERGRVYDMHSLRCELAAGVLERNPANNAAKGAMRHSSIDLTLNTYAPAKLREIVAALKNRRMLEEPGSGEQGTEGRASGTSA